MKSQLLKSLFDDEERRPLSVSELNEQVKAALEKNFTSVWLEAEIVNFIAAHSAPSRLKDGVLYVRVLQPTVHFEMERMRGPITAKLKERFGVRTVREVRFRLG